MECFKECEKLSLRLSGDVPKIDRLVAFATPAVGPLAAKIPVIGGGAFKASARVAAAMPPGAITDIAKRGQKAKGNADADVSLKGLDVEDKQTKTALRGIGFDLSLKGAIEKQMLIVNAGVDKVETKVLPKPLIDNRFKLQIRAENLAKIFVDEMSALIPSLGTTVKADAQTEITDNKEPRNIFFNLVTAISPKNITPGLSAIEATGEAKMELHLQSAALHEIDVSGLASLSEFNLKVPQPKEAASDVPLLSVESMNGVFPFRQKVNLDEIKAKAARAKVEQVAAAKDVTKSEEPLKGDTAEASKKHAASVESSQAPAPGPTPEPVPALAPTPAPTAAVALGLDERLAQYLEKYRDSKVLADNRMKSESYGEVRPTTQRVKPISAKRMAFKDLAMTDVEIDAELSQNMFSLNQMVFTLLGGKVQATAQVTFDSALRKARLTGQCTELDTRRLADSFPKLKDKMSSFSLLGSSPYIDGTMRLLYDAPSGDIAGGFEVTRIGKDQMRAVLLYVDPDETNPTIGTMRKALAVGEVRQVSVPIRNGQIGLDLDVRVFGAPIPTPKLQRFPLAQLVRNFTSQKPGEKDRQAGNGNSEEVQR